MRIIVTGLLAFFVSTNVNSQVLICKGTEYITTFRPHLSEFNRPFEIIAILKKLANSNYSFEGYSTSTDHNSEEKNKYKNVEKTIVRVNEFSIEVNYYSRYLNNKQKIANEYQYKVNILVNRYTGAYAKRTEEISNGNTESHEVHSFSGVCEKQENVKF